MRVDSARLIFALFNAIQVNKNGLQVIFILKKERIFYCFT